MRAPFLPLLLALASVALPAPRTDRPSRPVRVDCSELRLRRDRLQRAYDKINEKALPEDQLKDVNAALKALREALGATGKDAGERAATLKTVAGKLKGYPKLAKSLGKVQKGVAGNAAKAKKAAAAIDKITAYLDAAEQSYAVAERGTASQQLQDFQAFFDHLRKDVPGIAEVPGLGDLLDAYSQAIGGIVVSARRLEAIVARNDSLYKQAGGYEGELYLHGKSLRERRADQLRDLQNQLTALDEQITLNCGSSGDAAGAVSGCTDTRVQLALRNAYRKAEPAARERDRANNELQIARARVTRLEYEHDTLESSVDRLNHELSKAKPADATLLTRDIARRSSRLNQLRSELATAQRDYDAKVDAFERAADTWREQVQDWMLRAAQAERWTEAEQRMLGECHPGWDSPVNAPASGVWAREGAGQLYWQSFEFVLSPGTAHQVRVRESVSPGYAVHGDTLTLYWFTGGALEKPFFKMDVQAARESDKPSWLRYPEQFVQKVRVTFSSGDQSVVDHPSTTSSKHLIPSGASIERIEFTFDGHVVTWSSPTLNPR